MNLLTIIIGLIVNIAHASTLDTWGSANSGVGEMWSRIRGTLFTRGDPITGLSDAIIRFIFPLIGAAAVVMIIYAGIRMISAQGKEDVISEAKKIIYYALGGVVLALLSGEVISYFGKVFFPLFFQ